MSILEKSKASCSNGHNSRVFLSDFSINTTSRKHTMSAFRYCYQYQNLIKMHRVMAVLHEAFDFYSSSGRICRKFYYEECGRMVNRHFPKRVEKMVIRQRFPRKSVIAPKTHIHHNWVYSGIIFCVWVEGGGEGVSLVIFFWIFDFHDHSPTHPTYIPESLRFFHEKS